MRVLVTILFFLGGVICAVNFYLSFLRYPIFLLRGGRKSEFRWISGTPVIGSLSVAVGLVYLHQTSWILLAGLVLILIDTGGLHWFAGTILSQRIGKTDEEVQAPDNMP